MDTENTDDAAAMSPASRGSQPAAWAIMVRSGGPLAVVSIHFDWRHPTLLRAAGDPALEIIPLYRQPTLAETDCKAIRRAKAVACEMHDSRLEDALENLLERLG